MHTPEHSPLGKPVQYSERYDPTLLFPIGRKSGRDALGLTGPLPFFGTDIWNAYELSWLNRKGKPQIAVAMNFSDDPMMGLSCDRFSGSATARLETTSLRTAVLR